MSSLCRPDGDTAFNLGPGLSLRSFIEPSIKADIQTKAEIKISTHKIDPLVSSLFRELIVVEFGKREECQRSMLNIYTDGSKLLIAYADRGVFLAHFQILSALEDLVKKEILNFNIDINNYVSGVIDGSAGGENDLAITLDFPATLTRDPAKNRKIYIALAERYKNIASVADTFVGPTGGKTYFNATQDESVTLLKFMGELYRDQPRLNFSIVDGQAIVNKAIQTYENVGKFYYSPPTHSRYISLQQLTEALDLAEENSGHRRLIDNPDAFMAKLDAIYGLLKAESISNGAAELKFLIFNKLDDNNLQLNDAERQSELFDDFKIKREYTARFRHNPEEWHKNIDTIEKNWRDFLNYFEFSTHPEFRKDDLTNPVQVKNLVSLIRGDTVDNKVKEWVHGVSTPLVAGKLGYFLYRADGTKEWINISNDETLITMGEFARDLASRKSNCVVPYVPSEGILTREMRNPLVRRELGPSVDTSVVIETSSINPKVPKQLKVFKLDPTSPEYFDKLKSSNSPHRTGPEWDVIKAIPSNDLSEAAHAKRISQFNLFQQLLSRLGSGLEVEPFQREIRETLEGNKLAILHRGWIPGELVSRIEFSSRDNHAVINLLAGAAELAAVNHYAIRNIYGRDELLVLENNNKVPSKLLHFGVIDSFTNILNYQSVSDHENVSSILNAATFSFMIACSIYGHYGRIHDPIKKQEVIGSLVYMCEDRFRLAADKIRKKGPLDLEFVRNSQSKMKDTIKNIPARFSLESGIKLAQAALKLPADRIAALNSAETFRMMPLYESVLGDINLNVEGKSSEQTQEHAHKVEMVTRLASEVESLIKNNAADATGLDKVFEFLDGKTVDFTKLSLDLRESLLFSANMILMFKYDQSINFDKVLEAARTTVGDEEFANLLKEDFPELELDTDIAKRFHKTYNSLINAKETYVDPNNNPISIALNYILGTSN